VICPSFALGGGKYLDLDVAAAGNTLHSAADQWMKSARNYRKRDQRRLNEVVLYHSGRLRLSRASKSAGQLP
jgi:hypothetical protein